MCMCGHVLVSVGRIFILCSGNVTIIISFCLATPLQLAGPPGGWFNFRQLGERLHQVIWGRGLGEMLMDVPECEGLKYIPETQVNELGLPDLGYDEKVLLVRHEYNSAFDQLTSMSLNDGSGGVVVMGESGIGAKSLLCITVYDHPAHIIEPNQGKSCFLFYILLRRLCECRPTALELDNIFLLFDNTGAQVHDAGPAGHFALEKGVWALTDSSAVNEQPCRAFFRSGKKTAAWVVQVTSPARQRWYQWQKELKANHFVMSCFTWDELKALGFVLITSVLFSLT